MLEALNILGSGLFALLGAAAIVLSLDRWTHRAALRAPTPGGRAVFLFEGEELVDASPVARRLLLGTRRAESDLCRLLAVLTCGFGADVGRRLEAMSSAGRLLLTSPFGAGTLEAVAAAGRLRLTLTLEASSASAVDSLSLEAAEAELAVLRGLAEAAPQPVWTVDGAGRLSWANSAYLALADKIRAPANDPEKARLVRATWPLEPLFETPLDLADGQSSQSRLSIVPWSGGETLWYDVTTIRRGESNFHFATDVSGFILAEMAKARFVQTLSTVLTNLRTGIAVFDRSRQLTLFNPALVELSGLSLDFLSGRPRARAIVERLREASVLSNPQAHATWRRELAALEAAALEGRCCETWALRSGRTYRVTGRPHPEGTLTILLEDVSDEVALRRRVQNQLDPS